MPHDIVTKLTNKEIVDLTKDYEVKTIDLYKKY